MMQFELSRNFLFCVRYGVFALTVFAIPTASLLMVPAPALAQKTKSTVKWKQVSVLVYTKKRERICHTNIPFAVAAIKEMGPKTDFRLMF